MRTERLGTLNARICGGPDGQGAGDGPVVVLMHGFGAPGDDLVDLARVLSLPSDVRFVFPEAPLALDAWGSRAWWPIDPDVFERRARGEVVDRRNDLPQTLSAVRGQLEELLATLGERFEAPLERIVLGGFSQGSMLALDVALHLEGKLKGLVLLSTTLIAESIWRARMPRLASLRVFQSHGQLDPILPFLAATELEGLLTEAGAQVSFVPFRGGHEIPSAVLGQLLRFLRDA